MSMKKALLSTAMLALAAEAMAPPIDYTSKRDKGGHSKIPLNKKQMKARAKAKAAKKARKKNRR